MNAIRLPEISRGAAFEIEVDGQMVTAYEGETLATAMLAAGRRALATQAAPYPNSRLFCGMGTCYQCLVMVNGQPNVQACRTYARPGMKVQTRYDG
jgi:predicted molibdopterin-dependent oxidoreductase YjgC